MRGRPKGSGARDLTGEQFERLTVISRADSRSYRSYWNVRCSSGLTAHARRSNTGNGILRNRRNNLVSSWVKP